MVAVVLVLAAACANDIVPKGGWSGPTAYDGYLYVGGANGKLMRVSADTGLLDPSFEYPAGEKATAGAIYGSPVVLNGVIHAAGYSCRGNICTGEVFAVDPATGRAAWAEGGYTVDTKLTGQIVAGAGVLVFGTSKVGKVDKAPGYLYALDPEPDAHKPLNEQVAARRKWRVAVDGAIVGSPVVANDIAYFGTMARTFYAVDLRENPDFDADPEERVIWTFKTKGAVSGVPLVHNGRVIFGDLENKLYSLSTEGKSRGYSAPIDPARGEWEFTGGGWFWSRAAGDGKVIYASTVGGQVYALNSETGIPVWDAPVQVEGQVVGALLLIDSQRGRAVAVPLGKRDVTILRASDGEAIGDLFTGQPVKSELGISGDFVFVHTTKGFLYTFSAKSFEERACIDTRKDGERCA